MQKIDATFSVLTMSIASSAAMALGLAPDPHTNETQKDKDMAKFNIDLLVMLKDKTKNNLTSDESRFLDSVITDLQMKFVQENKK
jgi:hypothetical protein